jgi:serine/threonine-protein kinase RsbT
VSAASRPVVPARPLRRWTFEIATDHDRLWVAGEARRVVATLGFSPRDQGRVALSVAELASNAARHAGRGRIELIEISTPRAGCMVRAEDDGPGIAAVAEALSDGFSEGRWLTPDVPLHERRGLGCGLGSVQRLMDEMRVLRSPRGGLVIEAVLWLAPEPGQERGD